MVQISFCYGGALILIVIFVIIFYCVGGLQTGNTFDCAEKIYEAFGSDVAAEPIDIDSLDGDELATAFAEHDALVVGTPTWNTGADTERSGTGWDEIYYTKLPEMKSVLEGKKVAVFGLGDQSSYSANFADATGELYDVFQNAGCHMMDASWSQEGYEHEASKSIRGDKFCGLVLDMINQEDLTDERVKQWVAQLNANGILDGSSNAVKSATTTTTATTTTAPSPIGTSIEERIRILEMENAELKAKLEGGKVAAGESGDGFTAHFNPVTRKTMWTSADGRKAYFTSD